jgi:hypothetical protein|tara:strand:+ start:1594 stop:1806 length:213 start_codon:yes stop_codon:yes gene_type:complete
MCPDMQTPSSNTLLKPYVSAVLAGVLQAELGILVYDSIVVTVWNYLRQHQMMSDFAVWSFATAAQIRHVP